MRTLQTILLALVGVVMLACGADVGEHGTRLVVDEARVTSELLYMLPEVSQVPFTAAELSAQGVDTEAAIPIRVEVFDTTAVAWFAPGGEARIGGDWIIALWSVERVQISNETDTDTAPEVNEPGTAATPGDVAVVARPQYDIQAELDPTHPGEAAIIDFLDRLGSPDELDRIQELVTYHPGCLEE